MGSGECANYRRGTRACSARSRHLDEVAGSLTALVLDSRAFIAVERRDRDIEARLLAAAANGFALRTNAIIVAQVWRETGGRQALLARFLAGVEIWPVDEGMGRAAGVLLGRAAMSDPIDATAVLLANDGDE